MKYLFGHSFQVTSGTKIAYIDGMEVRLPHQIYDGDFMPSGDFEGWLYISKYNYYITNPQDPLDKWLGMPWDAAWTTKIKEKPPWLAGVIRELKVSGGL